jgi:formylglycine-generating enzyme required for sulfatase activity
LLALKRSSGELFLKSLVVIYLFFGLNAMAAQKCFSLFMSEKQVHSLAENVAKMTYALEADPEVYSNKTLSQQLQEKITTELTELRNLDITSIQHYFDKLKQLRLYKTEEDTQPEDRKSRLEKQQQKFRSVYQNNQIPFHEILPGKFLMGEIGSQVSVEITKAFQMMATPVTQLMWANLKVAFGELDIKKIAPINDPRTPDLDIVKIEGLEISMRKDHPVGNISWYEALEFIENLNRLSTTGDAQMQNHLKSIIFGHQKGDIYDLPTEAQWEFVLRDRGNANKKYSDRDDPQELQKYAWFSDGYKDTDTHPVATKQPRLVDNGLEFYDFEGNVWEWTKDQWDATTALPGGKDPLGTSGDYRVLRGGSAHDRDHNLATGSRFFQTPDSNFLSSGLRLIRTRP